MASAFLYPLLLLIVLIFIWLRKEVLTKILIHIDGFYVPISYPIFNRGKSILDWAKGRLPPKSSSHSDPLSGGLVDFWNDGSLLCTLINSAIPGACPNPYRHWKKPPVHAQDVAYKYFGIMPVFTESDLCFPLSPYLESKLFNYLLQIEKSICAQEKEKLLYRLISPIFVARGMGLYSAEQFKISEFFVYSRYDNISFFNIEIAIVGPYSTYCRTTVLEYMANEGQLKDDLNENSSENINIQIELGREKVRIAYVAKNSGIHEISISCNKESILGSPFYVNVLKYSEICSKNYCETNNNDDSKSKNDRFPNEQNDSKKNIIIEKNQENHGNGLNKSNNYETPIDTRQMMKISKYLKDLSFSYNNNVNISKKLLTYDKDKIWDNCPDYFTRENYKYFQKLVDNSFRKTCRITRAHPKIVQNIYPQFSSTSPVCRDHIVPEGFRKHLVDENKKVFPMHNSPVKGTRTCSPFSTKEKSREGTTVYNSNKYLSFGTLLYDSKNPKATYNEKEEKRKMIQKLNLQPSVKERKLFWETVFKKSNDEPKLFGSTTRNSFLETKYSFLNKETTKTLLEETTSSIRLKHVDSLFLFRKKSLSKSLSDLQQKRKKQQSDRSFDDILNSCCKVSLEDRKKIYLEHVRFINGELVDEWISFDNIFLSKICDRRIFRGERKPIR